MTPLEHVSYIAGLLAVGAIVWKAVRGTPALRRRRRDRKNLQLLLGGKR